MMKVGLLIWACFVLLAAGQLPYKNPAAANFFISSEFNYDPQKDESCFKIKLKTYATATNPTLITSIVLGLPSACPGDVEVPKEHSILGNPSGYGQHDYSGVFGFEYTRDIQPGTEITSEACVGGLIESKPMDYAVEASVNGAGYYTTGTLEYGPSCQSIPKLTCDAGETHLNVRCLNYEVRTLLTSKSKQANSYYWSTSEPGFTFSNAYVASPLLKADGPVCTKNVVVNLKVQGTHDQVAECSTLVQIVEDEKPKLLGLFVEDVTVGCHDIPIAMTPSGRDNCDPDIEVELVEKENDPKNGKYTIVRTWTVEDYCGNEQVKKQTVTVQDTEAPTLVGVPPHVTVECDEDPADCFVECDDNCDETTDAQGSEEIIAGDCPDEWTVIRTWYCQDDAGNTATNTQTIEVVDNLPPVIIGELADITVDCFEVPTKAPEVEAVDNCQTIMDVTQTKKRIDGSCDHQYDIVYTFTAEDDCGNKEEKFWTITVNDIEAPVLSGVDPDKTVQCNDIPAPCIVSVSDNCATLPLYANPVKTTQAGSCEFEYTITYTWSVADDCGNEISEQQIVTVIDDKPPKFTTTVPGINGPYETNCDTVPNLSVRAEDNCGTPTVVEEFGDAIGTCDYDYHMTKKWTATDECGNSNSMTQSLIVKDTIPPTLLGVPPDMTVSCENKDDIAIVNFPVTAVDNCPCDPTIVPDSVVTAGTCDDEETVVNTWTATDCCGHVRTQSQTITIYDDSPPRLIGCPGSVQLSIEDVPTLETAVVSALDNCVEGWISVGDTTTTIDGSCNSEKTIIRTWEATDDCGNTDACAATIHTYDSTPPTFEEEPFTKTVDCVLGFTYTFAEPVASDNGVEIVTVTLSSTTTEEGSCDGQYTLLKNWEATDICGNTAVKTYTIHVKDDSPPEWFDSAAFGEATQYIELGELCEDPIPVPDITATDECDPDVDVVYVSERTPGQCGEYGEKRTWTATDFCGNTLSHTVHYEVQDTTEPTLTNVPDHETINCEESQNIEADVQCSDDCDSGHVTVVPTSTVVPGSCDHSYSTVRTWTCQDCVGRQVKGHQTVTVQDVEAPKLIGVPEDEKLKCEDDIPAAVVTATDNCDTPVVHPSQSTIDGDCAQEYKVVRTWTATDKCGHSISDDQTIEVTDDTAPYFTSVPADVDAACDEEVPLVSATCLDVCDQVDVTVTFSESDVPGSCTDEKVTIRQWLCTDTCGNTETAAQTIHFTDTVNPVLGSIPDHKTIDCADDLDVQVNVAATDNCDSDVLVIHGTPETFGDSCEEGHIFSWTATDNCGNTQTGSQTITQKDDTPPTVTCEDEIVYGCNEEQPPVPHTVVDDCNVGTATVTSGSPVIPCTDENTDTRIFTPEDDCGNQGVPCTTTIRMTHQEDPTWDTTPPPHISVLCGDEIVAPVLTCSDICDPAPDVTVTQVNVPETCRDSVKFTVTCTTRCGQSIEFVQTVQVDDKTDPTVINVPDDLELTCKDEVPAHVSIACEDNCDDPWNADYSSTEADSTCPYDKFIIRTWTCTDCSGNVAVGHQTITMTDTTPPVIPEMDDETAECDDPSIAFDLNATDNCDDVILATFEQNTIEQTNAYNYKLVRQWDVTDDCGNSDTEVQTIVVKDTEPPTFTLPCPPDQVTTIVNPPGAIVPKQCFDKCEEYFDSTAVQTTEEGTCDNEKTYFNHWECTDSAGHTEVCDQTITVTDTNPPVIVTCPIDATYQVQDVPEFYDWVEANDAEGDVTIEYTTTEIPITTEEEAQAHFTETTTMYMVYREWTAVDECGNGDSCSQTIVVTDTIPPGVPGVPPPTAFPCVEVAAYVTEEADAAVTQEILDNVMDEINITIVGPGKETIAGTCQNSYILVRTWTAYDMANNSLSASQNITVTDNTPPAFPDPLPFDTHVTYECVEEPAHTLAAEDNCDPLVTNEFTEQTIPGGDCVYDYTVIRTWTAYDDCGNTASVSQTVVVVDSQEPTMTEPPATIVLECGEELPEVFQPTCTDTCAQDLTPVLTTTEEDGECAGEKSIVYSWTCDDLCGHVVQKKHTVVIQDETDPEWEVAPDDLTVTCLEDVPFPTLTGTDVCGHDVKVTAGTKPILAICETWEGVQSWTAVDDCGNAVTQVRTVTLEDVTDPLFANFPEDRTILCDEPHTPVEPTCSDECDPNPKMTLNDWIVDGTCPTENVHHYEYTCTDCAGNSVTRAYSVTTQDTEGPTLDTSDNTFEVECDQVPAVPTVVATDDCDNNLLVDYSVKIVYEEYSTDEFPSPDLHSAGVMSAGWYNAGEYVPYWVHGVASGHEFATSDCSNPDTSTCIVMCKMQCQANGCDGYSYSPGTQQCSYYDEETMKTLQTILHLNPELTGGVLIHPVAHWNLRTSAVLPSSEFFHALHPCQDMVIIRSWSAADQCGNSVSAVHTIEVVDKTPPYLHDTPTDIDRKCDEAPAVVVPPTATDNCSPPVTLVEDVNTIPGTCDAESQTVYVWTATDACGLHTSHTITVTTVDESGPTLDPAPELVNKECGELHEQVDLSATDTCGLVTVTKSQVPHDKTCSYYIINHWDAVDECGNTDSVKQTIHYEDKTPPSLTVPGDESVPCQDYPVTLDEATCTDICFSCTVVHSISETKTECPDTFVEVHEYYATDECGNKEIKKTTVSVYDTEEPLVITAPADVTIDCTEGFPAFETLTASDNCDADPSVTKSQSDGVCTCADSCVYVRSWIATDVCGNTHTTTQTITQTDTVNPTLNNLPADRIFECDETIPVFNVNGVDECSNQVTVTPLMRTLGGSCDDEYKVEYKWEAVDECGNKFDEIRTMTVHDTTSPVLTGVPADASEPCEDYEETNAEVTATDNCCEPTVTHTETGPDVFFTQPTDYTVVHEWTAVDCCGNTDTATQTIEVYDDKPPTLLCDGMADCPDHQFECESFFLYANVTAYDNCDNPTVTKTEEIIEGTCPWEKTQIITWTATDQHGLIAEIDQTITGHDNSPPVISGNFADKTVECPNTVNLPVWTATDACDDDAVTTTSSQDTVGGTCDDETIEYRTFTATDQCGNVATEDQTVTTRDTTPPVLSGTPGNVNVDCDKVASVWPGTITATDECDGQVLVNFGEEKVDGTCAWNYELRRTWVATDNCGNTHTHTQTVYVTDDLPPTWSATIYDDVTVEQSEAYSGTWEAPDAYAITCEDLCGMPTISVSQTVETPDYECESVVLQIRKWECVDVCGNSISEDQTITIVDLTPPTICEPEDDTVECDSIPDVPDVTATPEGDVVYPVIYEGETLWTDLENNVPFLDGVDTHDCFTILRSWSVADCAGNELRYTQTITVIDEHRPVFTQIPEDVTAGCECDEFNFPMLIDAVDNCDDGVGDSVELTEIRTDGTCLHSYDLERTWTVTDNCGNTNEMQQSITVLDEDPPSFCECPEEFVTASCDFVPPAMNVTARDACDPEPEFELYQQTIDGSCDGYYEIFREWVAVDDCGNSHSCQQTVTVEDDQAPVVLDPFEFCLFPLGSNHDKKYAVFENPEEMAAIVDNCGEPDIEMIACNSTQDPLDAGAPFNADCYLQPMGANNNFLYVSMETAEGQSRLYTLYIEAIDECGSVSILEQKFWVAHSDLAYRQKVEVGGCPHGIGATTFLKSLPTTFN